MHNVPNNFPRGMNSFPRGVSVGAAGHSISRIPNFQRMVRATEGEMFGSRLGGESTSEMSSVELGAVITRFNQT